jgi:hypothetical protein
MIGPPIDPPDPSYACEKSVYRWWTYDHCGADAEDGEVIDGVRLCPGHAREAREAMAEEAEAD